MIKPELYHKTVGILYDAYFNDTLVHGHCAACAVGNMVAANCGFRIQRDEDSITWGSIATPMWDNVFRTTSAGQQIIQPFRMCNDAQRQIDSTGYEWEELARIEYAFETAFKGKGVEDWMFNGLVAVLEVLKEIHQVADEDLLQANNKRFKDHYAKRVSVAV